MKDKDTEKKFKIIYQNDEILVAVAITEEEE